jgi:hypothetical protein
MDVGGSILVASFRLSREWGSQLLKKKKTISKTTVIGWKR